MTGRRLVFDGLAFTIVVATAVSSWWMIGDLTDTEPATADYLYRQPASWTRHERAIGITGVVLLAAALALLILMWRRTHPPIEWALLLGLWMGAGLGAAFVERALTVGVIGANIGGGMLLFASPILMIGLLGLSAAILWPLRRSNRRVDA